jgi:3-oxoacyl-[acyl-carrier-protein] synthase II
LTTFQEEVINFAKGDGTPRYNPFFIPKMILDIAAGHISMRYGFRGVNYATVSACASSTHALIDAFNWIRLGKNKIIIAGGSESVINESGVGGFNAMHALSTRNDDPKTASRPFDAKISGEMVGGGMTADAHHITAPHPEGLGAQNVMRMALEDAGLTTADIDYINVHGTSTPLGDISEVKAIQQVFGEDAYRLNISSTKSMTGHLLGAAGAIEAIATLLSVQNDICPPTINHFTDDPQLDAKLNLTFNTPQKRTINAALSNTFGFGGHNASVIFKKYAE